jgi:cytochrome c oxidase subunit III
MGTVVELRPRAQEEFTSSLGMLIFLGSWGMMFAALFFSYGFLRSQSAVWPPVGVPHIPLGLPALNTAILLASSFTFSRGLADLRRGRRGRLPWAVAATFALGALFLVLQVVVWRSLYRIGLTPSTGGLYGSVFYALTAIHALHVAAGLCMLLWVFARSLRGAYTEHNPINVKMCTLFWHFVDAMWVLMFVTVYVV